MPRSMIVMIKTRCIALSRVAALPPLRLDNARAEKNNNEIYERYAGNREDFGRADLTFA
jgi:hypothetical protein